MLEIGISYIVFFGLLELTNASVKTAALVTGVIFIVLSFLLGNHLADRIRRD